jgi:hypothetical protein
MASRPSFSCWLISHNRVLEFESVNFTNTFNPFVFIVVYFPPNWQRVKLFQNILIPFVSRGVYLRFTPKFHRLQFRPLCADWCAVWRCHAERGLDSSSCLAEPFEFVVHSSHSAYYVRPQHSPFCTATVLNALYSLEHRRSWWSWTLSISGL